MKAASTWLLLGVGALGLLNATGQVLMRLGGRDLVTRNLVALLSRPLWVFGLLLCWCCGLVWAVLVTRVPLGVATPLFMGTFFGAVALLSFLLLGEPLTTRQWIGFALLLGGIVLVSAK